MTRTERIKVAVLGLGTMGQHHARVLRSLPDRYDFVAAYDVDPAARELAATRYGAPLAPSMEAAIDRADAVYVATPTSTHHDVAGEVIARKKHVFVEKPLAHTSDRAAALVAGAREAGTRIGVGHTERFNPVVLWLRERLRGEGILSLNIERIGPRPPRINDVGIVTDLGVHDLDLFQCLTQSELQRVKCIGRATVGDRENVAQILVSTRSGVVGAININWLTPFKSRQIVVTTRDAFYRADLLRSCVQVCAGLDPAASKYSVEDGVVRGAEPLVAQALAFHKYVLGDDASGTVSGGEGLGVVRWVEHCLTDMTEER